MKIGLDDVIAAETALSHVDGEAGRLILRGHDLNRTCAHGSREGGVEIFGVGPMRTERPPAVSRRPPAP